MQKLVPSFRSEFKFQDSLFTAVKGTLDQASSLEHIGF